MSITLRGWIQSTRNWNYGMPQSRIGILNNAVCMNIKNGIELSKTLITPDFLEKMQGVFYGNPAEAISHILVYPFNIPHTFDNVEESLIITNYEYEDVKCFIPDFAKATGFGSTGDYLLTLCNKKIDRYFDDFRDFNGFTNIRVYLPFYGFVDVSTNEVMDKYLVVKLAIDYYTGVGLYFVCVADNENTDTMDLRILSKHQCKIAIEIPITSTNAFETFRNVLMSGVRGIAHIATNALTYNQSINSSTTTTRETGQEVFNRQERNPQTNRLRGESRTTIDTDRTTTSTRVQSPPNMSRDTLNTVSNTASSMLANSVTHATTDRTMFPNIEMWATKCVHIVITRNKYTNMGNYRRYMGSPLFETRLISDLEGYTEIGVIHLDGVDIPTKNEKDELEMLLTNGVIFS